jgi:hypothetical protein
VLDQHGGVLAGKVAPDRLAGPGEPGVVRVDERACDHGRAPAAHPALPQGVVEGVHQHEAQRGLRLRTAPVERDRRDDGRRDLVLHQQVPDLRTVAVGDHDVDVADDQVGDTCHRLMGRRDLGARAGPAVGARHRVAAEREQHPHGRSQSTSALVAPAASVA